MVNFRLTSILWKAEIVNSNWKGALHYILPVGIWRWWCCSYGDDDDAHLILMMLMMTTMTTMMNMMNRGLGALRAPTSSWRPFGPLDFVLRALRPVCWARLSSGPPFLTIFDHLDHFRPFGPFGPFWTMLDHFRPFLAIFDHFAHFSPFCTF